MEQTKNHDQKHPREDKPEVGSLLKDMSCCEKCHIDFSEKDKFDCSDSTCPCHMNHKKEALKKFDKAMEDFAAVWQPFHKKESDWEAEWDIALDEALTSFVVVLLGVNEFGSREPLTDEKATAWKNEQREKLKQLIRSQRQSVRDEIVEVIEALEIKARHSYKEGKPRNAIVSTYNQALSDLKERITSKKEV